MERGQLAALAPFWPMAHRRAEHQLTWRRPITLAVLRIIDLDPRARVCELGKTAAAHAGGGAAIVRSTNHATRQPGRNPPEPHKIIADGGLPADCKLL